MKTRVSSRQGTRAALRSLPRHPHAERTPSSLSASVRQLTPGSVSPGAFLR